jgi:hypothetical protein
MLFGNGSHVELLGSGRNGLRRPTHRDDVSRYSRVFADNEKDSIGSVRERGFPATAPHLGASTADRMH